MKKSLILIVLSMASVACNQLLDLTPTDQVSSKTMWETTQNAEYSVNHLFSYVWGYNSAPTAMGLTEALTDEMKYTSYNYNSMAYIPSEFSYGGSNLTAGYVDVYLGMWGSLYVTNRISPSALPRLMHP